LTYPSLTEAWILPAFINIIAKFLGDVTPEAGIAHTDVILHGILALPINAHVVLHTRVILAFIDIFSAACHPGSFAAYLFVLFGSLGGTGCTGVVPASLAAILHTTAALR